MTDLHPELDGLGTYEYGWHDQDVAGAAAQRGAQRGRGARHQPPEE